MIILSVLYPRTGESRFDHGYYLEKHVPLVQSRLSPMGLERVEIMRGNSAPDGSSAGFELICLLGFSSMEAMQQGLAVYGNEIRADISNFTNVQPLVQVNTPVSL